MTELQKKKQTPLDAILACSRLLMDEPEDSRAIREALLILRRCYDADRIIIFEPIQEEPCWGSTYQCCREDSASGQEEPRQIPVLQFRRWIELFQENPSVILSDTHELRDTFPQEWKTLSLWDIHRLIAVPLRHNGTITGSLNICNPRLCQGEDTLALSLAALLSERLNRIRAERRLHDLNGYHHKDILRDAKLGLWVIVLHPETGEHQMFADQTLRQLLGLSKPLSPEETYRHWYGRINDGYYHYVNSATETMIQTGQMVHLEYTWEHPLNGEVVVRCLGLRTEDQNGHICLEGYHSIISNAEQIKFVRDTSTRVIFEYNEQKKSIFFHTGRELLLGESSREEHFPECWITSRMVHPDFAEEFRTLFTRVELSEDVDGPQILLKNAYGTYEWFKIRIRHLGKNQKDMHTIIVLLEPANQERIMELEYMRKNDFYQAMLSETLAFAEVELETGRLEAAGGLWQPYQQESRQWGETFSQMIRRQIPQIAAPEDIQDCLKHFDLSYMKLQYDQGTSSHKYSFRRLINGQYCWVELVTHVFLERFTKKMYALLYLEDIDARKKRELAQASAAALDPLTNIFNRRAFEQEVCSFMAQPDSGGALIMLDLDDFKSINDTYGHPEGDAVLKRMTNVLLSTFRSRDIVGRIGGDEFVVFLKNVTNRDILDKRMEHLLDALTRSGGTPITYSAGITFADHREFSYSACLTQADTALYQSKQSGKNTYRYFDPETAEASR